MLLSFCEMLHCLLLFVSSVSKINHQVTGYKDGGISTDDHTKADRQGKIMQYGSTKEIQCQCGNQSGSGSDHGSGKSFVDGVIKHLFNGVFAADLEVFTDAVKDYDRIIDTITHDGNRAAMI